MQRLEGEACLQLFSRCRRRKQIEKTEDDNERLCFHPVGSRGNKRLNHVNTSTDTPPPLCLPGGLLLFTAG